MPNNKPNILDWLGFNREIDFSKHRNLGANLGGLVFVILVIVTGALVIPALFQFFKAVTGWGDFDGIAEQHEAIRNSGFVVAAIVGLPFIIWRSVVAQKQVNVAEQGHITDRLNKAVEGLGAERNVSRQRRSENGILLYHKGSDGEKNLRDPIYETITSPNLEVRIGAIFSLERIAQDSDRDHIQIMEILCAYIRQNTPAHEAFEFNEDYNRNKYREIIGKLPPTSIDIQTVLTVIDRRSVNQIKLERKSLSNVSSDDFRLDFGNCNLQKAELFNIKLDFILMSMTNLQGAQLFEAHLRGAFLNATKLQGAHLDAANLQDAYFYKTQLQGVHLNGAQLQRAFLYKAQMDSETSFDLVALRAAGLKDIDLRNVIISDNQLAETFGDASVLLSDNVIRPERWSDLILDMDEFRTQWRSFQESIGNEPPD